MHGFSTKSRRRLLILLPPHVFPFLLDLELRVCSFLSHLGSEFCWKPFCIVRAERVSIFVLSVISNTCTASIGWRIMQTCSRFVTTAFLLFLSYLGGGLGLREHGPLVVPVIMLKPNLGRYGLGFVPPVHGVLLVSNLFWYFVRGEGSGGSMTQVWLIISPSMNLENAFGPLESQGLWCSVLERRGPKPHLGKFCRTLGKWHSPP